MDQEKYMLTMDFAFKMININERRLSKIPTIIIGDTGVGKTELLRVYSLLINHRREYMQDLDKSLQNQFVSGLREEKDSPLLKEWEESKEKTCESNLTMNHVAAHCIGRLQELKDFEQPANIEQKKG